MRKGIATVSVGGTLDRKLEAISAARFDGIEIFDPDLVSSPLSPAELAHRCADLGLTIDLFQPIRDVEGTPPAEFGAVLHRVRAKFAVMGELGVDRALVCSSVRSDALDDRDLMAEQLAAVAELAAEAGIHVGYEALAWGRTTSRFAEAWDVVRRADHPHLGVVVDTFHMLSREDGPEALGDVPGDRIAFLQIADAPRLGMRILDWSRHFRCFPGQGNLDIAPLVAEVLRRGYRGPLSLEVFSDVVREAEPRATALDAMRSLLYLEEELRGWWDRPENAEERPRIDLFDPPAPPARVDPAWVEISTGGPLAARPLEDLLTALGFTTDDRGGWRNGAATVHLDESPTGAPAAVTALGVAVAEPTDVTTRAEAMLWPRVRGPRTGMHSPSGLSVYLEPTAATGHGEGDWLGIDHVGASVDPNLLPAEQSFFRTVLGMAAGDVTEYIQPNGRMRSRPLTPRDGDLRVIMSVDDGTRPDEARRGLNQIAFGVPDIFAVVQRVRAAGLELMPVPDNYYVDLAARFDLPAERLARLREHGVLYDRAPHGELMHCYTPVLGNGFYLEILQRVDGYRGYGAPNTPIRLAAHADQRLRPLTRPRAGRSTPGSRRWRRGCPTSRRAPGRRTGRVSRCWRRGCSSRRRSWRRR
ncbi:sugar phosphate isomerase/epimerase and 4-hydroxyphenylpyruvate domain-containing protein [Raineyella fluvialis]|uniref:3-dehydroshikimate dehydratase n=1 Tax=Raineyella fluvialis TaxID=2662261 RepID=A0A5Q2FCZ2_9ACTN|nr:sugar phosphate isomerase/epimerase and 4-hydroxyphenylpyruvate domain-containing protein [Raineyella fluvialis]QGF22953.1 TIM barrel protein [Raineyella fluvialis]